MKAHLDFETRSKLDLTRVGLWAYALHPSTDVMCLAVGTRAHGIDVLTRKDLVTPKLNAYWLDYPLFSAQNAPFEYAIYNLILHRRYGWPAMWAPSAWTCSMARAAMCGLPLDLDERSRVLEYKTPKDLEGRRVMLELSSPRADGTFDETPAKYERLYKYCATDVAVEMEDDITLPELPASEKEIWNLDLVMNRRGVMLDLDLAAKAAPIATALIAPLNKRLQVATKGAIDKATQVQAIRHWLETQGVQTPTLDKVALTDLLARPDLPAHVREVINVRRQVGKKTSVAKYQAALDMACPDGRARGQLQYFGSHTGRWAGRGLQPHNMPKGFKSGEQLAAVARIKEGDAGLFDLAYGDKGMDVLSDTLRGLFVAGANKTFLCADFNAIEARVLFWEAGEVAALAAYTAGKSPYVDMARYVYRNEAVSKETHAAEYDTGKRTILGCFAPDTRVLTPRGWVAIIDVQEQDRVWDGIEWVAHDGVRYQGERETLRFVGIGVTPEHRVLTLDGKWACASRVAAGGTAFLLSTTAMGAYGLPGIDLALGVAWLASRSSVLAATLRSWTRPICGKATPLDATPAPKKPQPLGARSGGGTPTSSPRPFTENDCSTESRPSSSGVSTLSAKCSHTTGAGASVWRWLGEKTAALFSGISPRLKAGATRLSNWTGLTSTAATFQAIYDSQLGQLIWRINAKSETYRNVSVRWRPKSSVYDVVNAGPRSRFTILTEAGPLIVHNCGFGMGWETFQANVYAETAKLGKPVRLSDEISERAVKGYREKYPNVVRLWYAMEAAAINAVRRPGECFQAANGKVLWGMNQDRRFLVCRLPSGRHLWYYKPSLVRGKTPWGEEKDELRYWATHPKTKEWCRLHTYGGKLVENVTQAIARDLLANGMLKVEAAGYETLLTVHDEVLAETGLKNPSVEAFIKTMCDVPPWALGCPVAAEGWTGSRYHK